MFLSFLLYHSISNQIQTLWIVMRHKSFVTSLQRLRRRQNKALFLSNQRRFDSCRCVSVSLCLLSACASVLRSCLPSPVFRTVAILACHQQFIIKRSLALIDHFPITVYPIVACCSIFDAVIACIVRACAFLSWALLIKLFKTKSAAVAALFRMFE